MRKSLQTKVGSFNQDDHCTQFEKLLRKTNTIEKKNIDLFDSSSQLQIPSCNIACKTNEVLSRCKKKVSAAAAEILFTLNTPRCFAILPLPRIFGQYIRKEKKGL